MNLEIAIEDPRTGDVRALLATHLASMHQATPREYSFALDIDELLDPAVTFFTARRAGRLVGIAALKRLDERHAELKSMHTNAAERGLGVGRALVERILSCALAEGYERVSLETGTGPEFLAARRLYANMGFTSCEAFASYQPSAYNTFMSIRVEPPVERGRS